MSVRGIANQAELYPRQKGEAYFTPAYVTEALLFHLDSCGITLGPIWEPAAGAGHIVDVLREWGNQCTGSDVSPAREDISTFDFLNEDALHGWQSIITNPPYGLRNCMAEAFLVKANSMCQKGLVAMLLPFEFDAAKSRRELVGGNPFFAAKLTIGKRIRWVNVKQKEAGPMSHHSWFVYAADPVLRKSIVEQGQMLTI